MAEEEVLNHHAKSAAGGIYDVALMKAYVVARSARRKIEEEIAEASEKLRDAYLRADVEAVASLRRREDELPEIYLQASMVERNASGAVFSEALERWGAEHRGADGELIDLQVAIEELKARQITELQALEARLPAIQERKARAGSNARQASDESFNSHRGYKEALKTHACLIV